MIYFNIAITLEKAVKYLSAIQDQIEEIAGDKVKYHTSTGTEGKWDTVYYQVKSGSAESIVAQIRKSPNVQDVRFLKGQPGVCDTCKKVLPDAKEREDNGLCCGVHCTECFNKMINDARNKSC